jgi:tripartite ATP-independent transporter DctP family solute receptor
MRDRQVLAEARLGALLVYALAVLAGCAGEGGDGGVRELKFGHVGAPGSLFALSAEEFARRVEERLGDRYRVVVFGASQLGGDEVMLQKLKLGTLDFSLPSTIMSSTVDEFGLFEMPYLVQDRGHMRRIEEAVIWPTLARLAADKGYEILAVWENGFRHVTNNVRPIVDPEDLRGIKLRTPRGRWRVRMFQAYGANPTPMPLSEVFIALQTGVMDGQENPFPQIYHSKLHEVQRYLSLTRHVYTPAFVTAGSTAWAKLPEDVRTILVATARETQAFVYETAGRMDADLLDQIGAAGVAVNEPDYNRFIEASEPIYAEFAASVPDGDGLIKTAVDLRNR